MKNYLIGLFAVAMLTTCTLSPFSNRDVSSDSDVVVTAPSVSQYPQPQQTDQEIIISSDAELRYALDELIVKGQLTEEQKSALYDIRVELGQKLEQNTVANVKLRSMMVDELLSDHGSQQGASMIGDMIHRNIMDRMAMMEDSINKVNSVLGFTAPESEPVQMLPTQSSFF